MYYLEKLSVGLMTVMWKFVLLPTNQIKLQRSSIIITTLIISVSFGNWGNCHVGAFPKWREKSPSFEVILSLTSVSWVGCKLQLLFYSIVVSVDMQIAQILASACAREQDKNAAHEKRKNSWKIFLSDSALTKGHELIMSV